MEAGSVVKANFQSMKISQWTEILLFAGANISLSLNRNLRRSDILLLKVPHPQTVSPRANQLSSLWNLLMPCPKKENPFISVT